MKTSCNGKKSYHHGNLAVSLLEAADEIATKFGLEAVTLRGCAKLTGVSPSSAFRHYIDKRALLTAFAARALNQLSDSLETAKIKADEKNKNTFHAVALAYVEFAIDKPAFFRAMCREEAIYSNDLEYIDAAKRLRAHLEGGFAATISDDDPASLSSQELLVWSSVHGLANLLIDGPLAKGQSKRKKLEQAKNMVELLSSFV